MAFQLLSIMVYVTFLVLLSLVILISKRDLNSISFHHRISIIFLVFAGIYMGQLIDFFLSDNLFSPELIAKNGALNYINHSSLLIYIIISIILALGLFFASTGYIETSVFIPLREFSLITKAYGKKSTRLAYPEIGATEIRNFARNLNLSGIALADNISFVHIHLEKLAGLANQLETQLAGLDPHFSILDKLLTNLTRINHALTTFDINVTEVSEGVQTDLIKINSLNKEIFESVSQMTEMLNLLTINISIEAANTDIDAFTTISEKGREIYKDFESLSIRAIETEHEYETIINHDSEKLDTIKSLLSKELEKLQVLTSDISTYYTAQQEFRQIGQFATKEIYEVVKKIEDEMPPDY